ncbi:MAG: hypothetical protein COA78_13835 [Blastopirellula sp.]|nr:MAG: hypothetical protein COA78_13835 [Blastopirellula sp.]
MRKIQIVIACLAVMFTGIVSAGPVIITSYDIEGANISGAGGWGHTYTGTITPIGGGFANYSGGSGTLNNGTVETTPQTTHIFNYPSDSSPVITLNFDDFYSLNSLLISGGDFSGNSLPGILFELDITIGSTTETFSTIGQGFSASSGFADDFVDLTGSSLNGLVTNQLTLSNFKSSYLDTNGFSIAEITLDGTTEVTPEPTSLAIFGIGALCMGAGAARRRRKEKLAANS